jgi:hypothetical protein
VTDAPQTLPFALFVGAIGLPLYQRWKMIQANHNRLLLQVCPNLPPPPPPPPPIAGWRVINSNVMCSPIFLQKKFSEVTLPNATYMLTYALFVPRADCSR